MSGDLDLELRYRRVLRLLPGYYRDKWEEDMVAAFPDIWMTGDPDEDSVTMEYDRPSRQEIASVIALAARLYLGGAAADLVFLLQAQVAGLLVRSLETWSSFFLFDFLLILAMSAYHQDAPPAARRPWLLALPGYYLLVPVPVLVIQATGNQAWLPDSAGLACLVVSLFCLAHAPRALARSAQTAGSGVWSLALMLLAGVAGVWRIVSLGSYVHDPHLIKVSLAELLILLAAAALVAPDAARGQAATSAPPLYPQPG